MVGAREAGATVFLAPASNCSDVKGAIPAGLRVVKVATLSQAVNDLEALQGRPARPVLLSRRSGRGAARRATGRRARRPAGPGR